jgi:hypothetical protein
MKTNREIEKELTEKWIASTRERQAELIAENTRLYGPDTAKWPHKTSRVVDANVEHVETEKQVVRPEITLTPEQAKQLARDGYLNNWTDGEKNGRE